MNKKTKQKKSLQNILQKSSFSCKFVPNSYYNRHKVGKEIFSFFFLQDATKSNKLWKVMKSEWLARKQITFSDVTYTWNTVCV